MYVYIFFFNDTATTEIYTLSLHDALPIYVVEHHTRPFADAIGRLTAEDQRQLDVLRRRQRREEVQGLEDERHPRSEEHTSELQSRQYLVCRLLLEKKKITNVKHNFSARLQ